MKSQRIFFILVSLLLLNIISCSQNKKISSNIDDWFKAGSKPDLYEIGKDDKVKYNDEPALYLKSITDVDAGFGTIMRNMKPGEYIGKRIKLTGVIKSENINVWAGMWLRIDSPERGKSLQFDNMSNRPIKGTNDWTTYNIVLDVPENSTNIAFGVLVSGNGEVWFSNLSFEVVGNDVPATNLHENYNIDWFKAGSKPHLFEIGKDENIKHNEQVSHYLKSTGKVEDGFGTIMKYIKPDEYSGKRVRLTGSIKSENIDDWAGMWMRVDETLDGKSSQFDNMQNRPIKGTNDWTKYEIVLDVPENSIGIAFGVLIHGSGEIWFDDLTLEVVGDDVPATNLNITDFNNDSNKLPDKLVNIPDGIVVKHTPDSVLAARIKDDTANYYWFHKTSVTSTNEDLEITEFGSYSWNSDHWEFSTVTGKPFTKEDFEDWYNCKNGILIKGKDYADKNNWYRNAELKKNRALWYYLGKNKKGEIFKGIAEIEYLPEMKKK